MIPKTNVARQGALPGWTLWWPSQMTRGVKSLGEVDGGIEREGIEMILRCCCEGAWES